MSTAPTGIAVELFGGPLDGMKTVVPLQAHDDPIYLLRHTVPGQRTTVHAYQFANRTLHEGTVWVLSYVRWVGQIGAPDAPPLPLKSQEETN